jgi:hypothetical protein
MLTHTDKIAAALYRAQGGQWLPQELQARRENLRQARVSLEQQMERLTDAYLANVLQLEEDKRRRLELDQRLSVIAEQKRQLEANVGHHDQLAGMVQSIEAFCQRVQQGLSEATFEQKRQLIELLVDRVVVTGEEVEIRYVIPTSPKGETIRFCHLRLDYFNPPVSTAQFQQVQRCIRPSRQDADEVNDLDGDLALLGTRAGELGNMADPWPIDLKIGTQLSAHLDDAALEAPTLPSQGLGLLNLCLRIGKVSSQIGLEGGFIAFNHKERIGVLRTQEPP